MTIIMEHRADVTVRSPLPAMSRMVGVGTAVCGTPVSQPELLELLQIDDPKVRSVYLNSAINRRFLSLPAADAEGRRNSEPQGDLLDKHKTLAVENLGLSRHDVRHTVGVLRDHGTVSSGSFLFSYERLVDEDVACPGDYGVLMTMGPSSTIETALIQW